MKELHDIIASAIDYLDEEYSVEAADCFPLKKSGTLRQSFVNAEDLVEMKKQVKKSNLMVKIVGIAAAFVCVATVAVLLVVNINKHQVPVLGNLESVLSESEDSVNQNTSDISSDELFDKPGNYGCVIDSVSCSEEYTGKEITASYVISNGGDVANYGVALYVNGVQTEFKLNDSTETETNHIFNFELGEEKELNFKFTPYNCKTGETARVDMIVMLKPDYTLPDATRLGFGNNHSISSSVPFEVKINKDAPEKDFGGVYKNVTVTDVTQEIEKEYSNKDYLTGEITYCHLDHMTVYELYKKDVYDPFLSCDNSLELTTRSLGLPSEFYASVYIDHKIMPAFDGKCYAYFNVDRQHVSTAKAKIDTSELSDGIHHIYMQIIPVGESSTELNDCRKTVSKLLVKGEKYIKQAQDTYDNFIANENANNNQQTDSKDDNSNIGVNQDTGVIFKNTSIQNMTKIEKNTILAVDNEKLQLIDLNNYKVIKEIPRADMMLVQQFDNGFMVVDANYYYEIYDVKGNKLKRVDIPMRQLQGEELQNSAFTEKPTIEITSICVSADGKSVAYYGYNGICTNTVDLDNEKIIHTRDEIKGGRGELPFITKFYKFEDGIIYGEALKFNNEINNNEFFFVSLDTKTKEWKVYYKLNDDQQIFAHSSPFVDNSFIIVDAGADDRFTEGKLPYLIPGETELKEFTCEEGLESVRAFISPNGKFILTTYNYTSEFGMPLDSEIKLYDVKTGEVLLKQKAKHIAQTAYIDENDRKLYVVSATEFSVFDF